MIDIRIKIRYIAINYCKRKGGLHVTQAFEF